MALPNPILPLIPTRWLQPNLSHVISDCHSAKNLIVTRLWPLRGAIPSSVTPKGLAVLIVAEETPRVAPPRFWVPFKLVPLKSWYTNLKKGSLKIAHPRLSCAEDVGPQAGYGHHVQGQKRLVMQWLTDGRLDGGQRPQ